MMEGGGGGWWCGLGSGWVVGWCFRSLAGPRDDTVIGPWGGIGCSGVRSLAGPGGIAPPVPLLKDPSTGLRASGTPHPLLF